MRGNSNYTDRLNLSACKQLRSGREGCSGFRFAFDDFMKRLRSLPLNDVDPGYISMQGFKGRFHLCHHAAFDDTVCYQCLCFLNGEGRSDFIIDQNAGNVSDKDKVSAPDSGGQSRRGTVGIDIVAFAIFIGGYG